jgi:hypothetical protein
MKPGSHGLVWAIPRTSHWTGDALERAGFEVRDVITHLFGSGFPKSLDISKAIDKSFHLERERVPGGQGGVNAILGKRKPGEAIYGEAKEWNGWGTALKPAAEFWFLIRKPLSEKTVAANVLKWGCGGLNIDGSRIEASDAAALAKNWDRMQSQSQSKIATALSPKEQIHLGAYANNSGRFPANLVFSHSPYCTDTQCDIECAIAMLDEQSGVEASRYFYCAKVSASERNTGCDNVLSWENVDLNQAGLVDELSQHLKDISDDILLSIKNTSWSTDLYGLNILEQYPKGLMYTIGTALKLIIELKTSNYSQSFNTRENILDAIRTIEANGLSLAETVEALNRSDLTTIRGETASLLGVSSAVLKTLLKIKNRAKQGNIHSTVKPQKLMRYLCKLVTPPNGIVLDPFMGSGSTGMAALSEGFDFVGIEKEKEYFQIAEARITACKNY